MLLKGKVHKLGKNINTDIIIPARYLNIPDSKVLAEHLMEDLDPNFSKKIMPQDIIVAEENFGCGSSREHAPIAIKEAGISCVVAKSFARIFFRNSINIGLPVIEAKQAVDKISDGDILEIDLSNGVLKNLTTNQKFKISAYPKIIQNIIKAGGIINVVKNNYQIY